MKRRVVVTGIGVITPLGITVESFWNALIQGKSGVVPITRFDVSDYPVRIAAEVKGFEPTDYIDKKYGLNSTDIIKMESSKYSTFSAMISYRQYGIKQYMESCGELRKVGLDCSNYFNLYYFSILIFGANFSAFMVRLIKKVVGRRLHL